MLSAIVHCYVVTARNEVICGALLTIDDVLECDGGHGRKREWVDGWILVGPGIARVGQRVYVQSVPGSGDTPGGHAYTSKKKLKNKRRISNTQSILTQLTRPLTISLHPTHHHLLLHYDAQLKIFHGCVLPTL